MVSKLPFPTTGLTIKFNEKLGFGNHSLSRLKIYLSMSSVGTQFKGERESEPSGYISDYLLLPLRTIEQARQDGELVRNRAAKRNHPKVNSRVTLDCKAMARK